MHLSFLTTGGGGTEQATRIGNLQDVMPITGDVLQLLGWLAVT